VWPSEYPKVLRASWLELISTSKEGLGNAKGIGIHLAKIETTQRSSIAVSVGKNILCFIMSTSSLTTQLTFLNVAANTSMKQYSLIINVRMVI
jgi:hypothetical protein